MPPQVFKADAHYVGSKIDIYALKERPEFRGHYKRVHKGAVVLALSARHISDASEAQARAGSRAAVERGQRRRWEAGVAGAGASSSLPPRAAELCWHAAPLSALPFTHHRD